LRTPDVFPVQMQVPLSIRRLYHRIFTSSDYNFSKIPDTCNNYQGVRNRTI